MTTINNSLLAQMQSMSLEAIAKPQNNDNIVNNTTNNFGDLLSNALNTVNDLHKDAGNKAIEGYKEIMSMPV